MAHLLLLFTFFLFFVAMPVHTEPLALLILIVMQFTLWFGWLKGQGNG